MASEKHRNQHSHQKYHGDHEGDDGMVKTKGVLELLISCTDLADLDIFSKTDPLCVLFIRQFGQWKEYARTEAVPDHLSPKFTETFLIDYDKDFDPLLRFSVYDIDTRSTDLSKHDHVGSVEFHLSHLIPHETKILSTHKSLHFPGDAQCRGWIHITTEFIQESRSKVHMQCGASKLDKKGFFSMTKPDTFLEVERSINSTEFHPIHRTEIIPKSQHPRWRPFEVTLQKLCNGDHERPIKFTCWHVSNTHEYVVIGQSITTTKELSEHKGKIWKMTSLFDPKRSTKKKQKPSGVLKFFNFRLDMAFPLIDYIRGGCSLRFMLAIDFTASNGVQTQPHSLHYLDGVSNNQYIDAIKTVGAMLSHYDLEQRFPVYGFGAKLGPKKKTKDCFPVSKKSEDSTVRGIQGILEAYRAAVPRLIFSGPSHLSSVIKTAIMQAKKIQVSQENQQYNLLMIITDGVVNDLDTTIDAIVESSSLPVSIVIVGIGPADFTLMEQFHTTGENHLLLKASNGKLAVRENVYFAAFRKQKYSSGTNATIAKEILAKVSLQVLQYFKMKNIEPNKPKIYAMDTLNGPWVTESTDLRNGVLSNSMSTEEINFSPSFQDLSSATHTGTLRKSKSTANMGSMCPTCGSFFELAQGNSLYSLQNTL